jgi:hypothetical protein
MESKHLINGKSSFLLRIIHVDSMRRKNPARETVGSPLFKAIPLNPYPFSTRGKAGTMEGRIFKSFTVM